MFGAKSIWGVVRNARFWGDSKGNIAPLMALMLVPIIGAISMGVEVSSWYLVGRNAQNAADSAAVAAANNGAVYGGTLAQAKSEGQANARRYGFTDNGSTVTVDVVDKQLCPDGKSACYMATVRKRMPVYLTRIVGFNGDYTIGTQKYKTITSVAYAEPVSAITFTTCLTTKGNDSKGNGLDLKGIPKSNMAGCMVSAVGPSSPVNCNGQGVGGNPPIFSTGAIDSACTTAVRSQNQSTSAYVDPYQDYYKKIPCSVNGASTNCDSSSTATCNPATGTISLTVGACYQWSGSGSKTVSIDSTTLSGPGVIYLKDLNLNLNDNAVLTANGVAIVFTGTSPGGITGGKKGAVNITAPSDLTATWHGVAAFQDTHLVTSSTYTAAAWSQNGGTPTIDTVGLMYLPLTDVSFGGGAGSPVGTPGCFIAIFHSFDANGTGLSMNKTGCTAAGLTDLPTVKILRAALVK